MEFINTEPQTSSVNNTENGIVLEWEAVEEATFYDVQRKTSNSDWQTLGRIINRTSYGDASAVPGLTYQYRIVGGYAGPHLTKPSSAIEIRCEGNSLSLPGNLTRIESQAFVGIDADSVIIPSSVTDIAADAFDSSIIIVGEKGSTAETFAMQEGLVFAER